MVTFSQTDHARAAEAIRAAEAKTSGQIVCVVARSASSYMEPVLAWAIAAALICPWLFMVFTQWSVTALFAAQLLVFFSAYFFFSYPALRMRLVPRAVKRRRAHRLALEQFHARGVGESPDRMGVMIFASLAERYVRIVTDKGVAARIPEERWSGVVNEFVNRIHEQDFMEGLILAIERCGDALAAAAPPTTGENTLPDRVYIV